MAFPIMHVRLKSSKCTSSIFWTNIATILLLVQGSTYGKKPFLARTTYQAVFFSKPLLLSPSFRAKFSSSWPSFQLRTLQMLQNIVYVLLTCVYITYWLEGMIAAALLLPTAIWNGVLDPRIENCSCLRVVSFYVRLSVNFTAKKYFHSNLKGGTRSVGRSDPEIIGKVLQCSPSLLVPRIMLLCIFSLLSNNDPLSILNLKAEYFTCECNNIHHRVCIF